MKGTQNMNRNNKNVQDNLKIISSQDQAEKCSKKDVENIV